MNKDHGNLLIRQNTIILNIAFAALLLGSNVIAAEEGSQPKAPESFDQLYPVPEAQENPDDISEGSEGYHPEGRRIWTPIDVERDYRYSIDLICQLSNPSIEGC